jgi:hypothetical protein
MGAQGSLVVKALCYKPEGRGFDTRWGNVLNVPIPSGRTRPYLVRTYYIYILICFSVFFIIIIIELNRKFVFTSWQWYYNKTKHTKMHITIWSWALLERTLDVTPLDSFPAFHGTRRFNTEFTRALHLFLSLARPIQSTSPHPTSPRSILILSTHLRLGLPGGLFSAGFPHQ